MKKFFLLLVIVLAGLSSQVKAQLPAITIKTMEGKTVRTDTLSNNGKPFIIDFFATWCKPCNRELDAISEVYEEWQDETGVKICFSFGIRLGSNALIAFTCCTRLVGVDSWNKDKFVLDLII